MIAATCRMAGFAVAAAQNRAASSGDRARLRGDRARLPGGTVCVAQRPSTLEMAFDMAAEPGRVPSNVAP